MRSLLAALVAASATAPDLSFAGFKLMWTAYGLTMVHLDNWRHPGQTKEGQRWASAKGTKQEAAAGHAAGTPAAAAAAALPSASHGTRLDPPDVVRLQSLFRYLTDELLELAVDSSGGPPTLLPGRPTPGQRVRDERLPACAYVIFSLYLLHSTQLVVPRVPIVLPEPLWPVVDQLLKELAQRQPTLHAAHVLAKMIREGVFEWTLERQRDAREHNDGLFAEWQSSEPAPAAATQAEREQAARKKELKTDFAVARAAARQVRRPDDPKWLRATSLALEDLARRQQAAYSSLAAASSSSAPGAGSGPGSGLPPVHLDNLHVDLTQVIPLVDITTKARVYQQALRDAQMQLPWEMQARAEDEMHQLEERWREARLHGRVDQLIAEGARASATETSALVASSTSPTAQPDRGAVMVATVVPAAATPVESTPDESAIQPYLFAPLPSLDAAATLPRPVLPPSALIPAVRKAIEEERGLWVPRKQELVPPIQWRGINCLPPPALSHAADDDDSASWDPHPEQIVWRRGNEAEFVEAIRTALREDRRDEEGAAAAATEHKTDEEAAGGALPPLERFDGLEDFDHAVADVVQASVREATGGAGHPPPVAPPTSPPASPSASLPPLSPSILLHPFRPAAPASILDLAAFPAEERGADKPMHVARSQLGKQGEGGGVDSDDEVVRRYNIWPMVTRQSAPPSPPASRPGGDDGGGRRGGASRDDFLRALGDIREQVIIGDSTQRNKLVQGTTAANRSQPVHQYQEQQRLQQRANGAPPTHLHGNNATVRALLLRQQQQEQAAATAAAASAAASASGQIVIPKLLSTTSIHLAQFRARAREIQQQHEMRMEIDAAAEAADKAEAQAEAAAASSSEAIRKQQQQAKAKARATNQQQQPTSMASGLGSALDHYRVLTRDVPAAAAEEEHKASGAEVDASTQASSSRRPSVQPDSILADLVAEQYASMSSIVRTPAMQPTSSAVHDRTMSNLALGGEGEEQKQPEPDPTAAAAPNDGMPPPAPLTPQSKREAARKKMREKKAKAKARSAADAPAEEAEEKTNDPTKPTAKRPSAKRKAGSIESTGDGLSSTAACPPPASAPLISAEMRDQLAAMEDMRAELDRALGFAPDELGLDDEDENVNASNDRGAPSAKRTKTTKPAKSKATAATAKRGTTVSARAPASTAAASFSHVPPSASSQPLLGGLLAAGLDGLLPDTPGLSWVANGAATSVLPPPTPRSTPHTPTLTRTAPSTPSFLPASTFGVAPAAAAAGKGKKPMAPRKPAGEKGKRKTRAEDTGDAAEPALGTAPSKPKRSRQALPSRESIVAAAAIATAAVHGTLPAASSTVPLLGPMSSSAMASLGDWHAASADHDDLGFIDEGPLPFDADPGAEDAEEEDNQSGMMSDFSLEMADEDDQAAEAHRHHHRHTDALANQPSELPEGKTTREARKQAAAAKPKATRKPRQKKPATTAAAAAQKPTKKRQLLEQAAASDAYQVHPSEFVEENGASADSLLQWYDQLLGELPSGMEDELGELL